MGAITILCPSTGRQVATGVEVDPAVFDAIADIKASVDCWACGRRHVWSKRWATLVCDADPLPSGVPRSQRQPIPG